MQNGFSLLIRDIYGVDWWKKKRESKISCNCPFKCLKFTSTSTKMQCQLK
jgi:hypothetical protein